MTRVVPRKKLFQAIWPLFLHMLFSKMFRFRVIVVHYRLTNTSCRMIQKACSSLELEWMDIIVWFRDLAMIFRLKYGRNRFGGCCTQKWSDSCKTMYRTGGRCQSGKKLLTMVRILSTVTFFKLILRTFMWIWMAHNCLFVCLHHTNVVATQKWFLRY